MSGKNKGCGRRGGAIPENGEFLAAMSVRNRPSPDVDSFPGIFPNFRKILDNLAMSDCAGHISHSNHG